MSLDNGTTWAPGDIYVVTSANSNTDPLPVLKSDIQGIRKFIIYKTSTGLKTETTVTQFPYNLNWTQQSLSTNSYDSYPTITYINPQFSLAYGNSSDGEIYYKYYWTNWSSATNLSAIIPGSGVHQTPSITNIQGSNQVNVVWKEVVGTGANNSDHIIYHRRSTNYNTWPNEYFKTYYETQEAPSISGLSVNNIELVFQVPAKFGASCWKMNFNGNHWGIPTLISNYGRYPSISEGNSSVNYIWTDGLREPYNLEINTLSINKDKIIDPLDYYRRSITLLDSSGSYFEVKIDNVFLEFDDGKKQKFNYSIPDLGNFNMTIYNCFDSLSSTILTHIPQNTERLVYAFSIGGREINNILKNPNYVSLSLELLNQENISIALLSKDFELPNETNEVIQDTIKIELKNLLSNISRHKIRGILHINNYVPKGGVFATLGHIFDYAKLGNNYNNKIIVNFKVNKSECANSISILNYPNPFNPITTIEYSIPQTNNVEIKIFNILGEEMSTLINKVQSAGSHEVQFNSGNLPSGIYICRIRSNEQTKTTKMLLLK